jgi:hypothetical protein
MWCWRDHSAGRSQRRTRVCTQIAVKRFASPFAVILPPYHFAHVKARCFLGRPRDMTRLSSQIENV